MSADTSTKRFSAISPLLPWRGLGLLPSGTVDAGERAALLFRYAGIAGVPVVVTYRARGVAGVGGHGGSGVAGVGGRGARGTAGVG